LKENNNNKLLELRAVTKYFGGLAAVQSLDLEVMEGEIMGLIGPNGAGKTTVFNLVSGVLKPTRGTVVFERKDITRLKANKVAKRGLVRTFQANTLFPDFTVIDNVLLGCHLHTRIGLLQDLVNTPSIRKKRDQTFEKAADMVKFVGLENYRMETAKNLSHGHQRALGVCIALAADPKLLMLDEPVTGMNVEEKETMMELISRIRERGITVLVVEHDMRVVMGLCDRIAVLNFGTKIAQGTPEEIRENQDVIEAYLGADE
jgi:branched-chain amino acid transport system ATP-binding protein